MAGSGVIFPTGVGFILQRVRSRSSTGKDQFKKDSGGFSSFRKAGNKTIELFKNFNK